MRTLITAGPTREPIDAVRFIGNRSSGRMGAALAEAAVRAGHVVTLIVGPVSVSMPAGARRIDVETAQQMRDAVLREFPNHDALIMAAAVADYRPRSFAADKLPRAGQLTIELEATPDILAEVGRVKRPAQRTVGFSLEVGGDVERAREKLRRKNCDLIVYNPAETMESGQIAPTLLWPDGRMEAIASSEKGTFAQTLISRVESLFAASGR